MTTDRPRRAGRREWIGLGVLALACRPNGGAEAETEVDSITDGDREAGAVRAAGAA